MSNLMIDTPGTRYSPLAPKVSVYKNQAISPANELVHPPFLTSEVPVPQNTQTVEQELIQYMLETYPKATKHW